MLSFNDQILDYAKAHTNPDGPGDARPTAMDILEAEGLRSLPNRLTNQVILITGGASGLGLEMARTLHLTGAIVFITGRCGVTKGNSIAASIGKASSGGSLHPVRFVQMDFSDLATVVKGVEAFREQAKNRLSLLICNAGIMSPQSRQETVQGHEMQFGVNYLAHFLLFQKLREDLLSSSTEQLPSRVIIVSSCAHRNSGIMSSGDYDIKNAKYNPDITYGQSKTADIYLANEIERRFGEHGLHGLSVHPGIIMETGITRHIAEDHKELEKQISDSMPAFSGWAKNTGQGAGCILWAAVAAKLKGVGGLFLEDCNISQPVKSEACWFEAGRAAWCYDENRERRLWADSVEMIASWL